MIFWTTRTTKLSSPLKLIFAVWAVVALGLSHATEDFAPKAFSANYSVEYGGVAVADVDLEFSTGNGLQLVTESKAKGLATLLKSGTQREVSSLGILNGQIVGGSYSSTNISTRRAPKGKTRVVEDRELEVKFNWENATAAHLENDKKTTIELKPGSLDRQALPVMMRYQLRKATAADPTSRPPVLDYYFVDQARLRHYKMKYAGDEILNTKFGPLNTAKYSHTTSKDKQTVLWLAEDKDWLPVRFDKIKPNKPTLSMAID